MIITHQCMKCIVTVSNNAKLLDSRTWLLGPDSQYHWSKSEGDALGEAVCGEKTLRERPR